MINGKTITPDMVIGKPRKGRKIVYTGDTRPCKRTLEVAMNADVLIHDASFSSELQEWAVESKHSTAREAAEIAKNAGVSKLLLGHFSARFKDLSVLEQEAQSVFPNSYLSREGETYEIK